MEKLPEGWKRLRLGDVCKMVIGGTPSRDNLLYWDKEKSTNNLWVSIKDMDRRYIENTEEYLTDEGVKHSNAKLIPPNTVLLSFKLTIGKISISKKFLYTNEAIAAIITKNSELDNLLLFYGLHKWDLLQDVDQAVKGMTLNKNKLQAIKILYPSSLPEQHKIADILETIDNAIERTDTIIEKYKRIKQGLTQDLLTRGVVGNEELGVMNYELRDEKKHRFKDSPLGRIPEEWEVVELQNKDIIKLITDGSHFSPQPVENGEYYIATIENISDNKIDMPSCKKISRKDYENLKKNNCEPQTNDVLFTKDGTIGVVIKHIQKENLVVLSSIAIIRSKQESLLSNYLVQYLKSNHIWKQLETLSGGSALKRIVLRDIKGLLILLPPLSEQHIIASILSQTDETIEKEQKYKQKLEKIKQGLMGDLLTGKVRVNHLIKEGMKNVQTA